MVRPAISRVVVRLFKIVELVLRAGGRILVWIHSKFQVSASRSLPEFKARGLFERKIKVKQFLSNIPIAIYHHARLTLTKFQKNAISNKLH